MSASCSLQRDEEKEDDYDDNIELTMVGLDDDIDVNEEGNEMFDAEDVINYLLQELSTQTFVPIPVDIVSQVFCRINVPPDGSCFYSAAWIGALTHERPEVDVVNMDPFLTARGAKRLRLAVARRLLLSRTRRTRLKDAGIDPVSYAENVASGAWADEAEILAAARELRRPVLVFERSATHKGTAMAWVGGKEQDGFPVVVWRKHEHYDALLPKAFSDDASFCDRSVIVRPALPSPPGL